VKLQVSNFRSGRNSHLRQASGIRNGENMDEGVDEYPLYMALIT
jgi:hypothetical protein